MKIFGLCIKFLIITNISFGQVSFVGNVLDNDKNPLLGVNIYSLKSLIGTSTNEYGQFFISTSIEDSVFIFQYLGYAVDTVSLKKNVNNHIVLNKKDIFLSEILVTPIKSNDKSYISDYLSFINQKLNNKKIKYNAYTKNIWKAEKSNKSIIAGMEEFNSINTIPFGFNPSVVIKHSKQTRLLKAMQGTVYSIALLPNIFSKAFYFENNAYINPYSENGLESYLFTKVGEEFIEENKLLIIEFSPKNTQEGLPGKIFCSPIYPFIPQKIELNGVKIETATFDSFKTVIQLSEFNNDSIAYPYFVEQSSRLKLTAAGAQIRINTIQLNSDFIIENNDFDQLNQISLKFEKTNSSEDSMFWKENRPIPLTNDQIKAYEELDSIFAKNTLINSVITFTDALTFLGHLPITNAYDFYHQNDLEGNYFGVGIANNLNDLKYQYIIGYSEKLAQVLFNVSIIYPIKSNQFNLSIFNFVEPINPNFTISKTPLFFNSFLNQPDYTLFVNKKGAVLGYSYFINNNLSFNTTIGYVNVQDNDKLIFSEKTFIESKWSILYDNSEIEDYGWYKEKKKNPKYSKRGFSLGSFIDRQTNKVYNSVELYFEQNISISNSLSYTPVINYTTTLSDYFPIQYFPHIPGKYSNSWVTTNNVFNLVNTDFVYLSGALYLFNSFSFNNIFTSDRLKNIDFQFQYNLGYFDNPKSFKSESILNEFSEITFIINDLVPLLSIGYSKRLSGSIGSDNAYFLSTKYFFE